MQITIRTMTAEDMPRVLEIFQQGIDTEAATFVTEAPSADAWDQKYIKDCRLVAQDENGTVQGWRR
jgi:phosphinothricin acetyltransferase